MPRNGYRSDRFPIDPAALAQLVSDGKTTRQIAAFFGCSADTVRVHSKDAGVPHAASRNTAWTPEHDAFIRQNAEKMNDRQIATALGRPYGSIDSRRRRLGIIKPAPCDNPWTEAECKILAAYYPRAPLEKFQHLLPARGPKMIKAKADRMGIPPFGGYPKEIRDLVRLASKLNRIINERTEH